MQTNVSTCPCRARALRTLVAPLLAAALLAASLLVVWRADPPALSQQQTPSVEPGVNSRAGSDRATPWTPEPALRALDGVVHHG